MGKLKKLSEEQLSCMRELYINGSSINDLVDQFHVSRVTINNHSNKKIGGKNGKTWKQLRAAKIKQEEEDYNKSVLQGDFDIDAKNPDISDKLSKIDRLRIKQIDASIKQLELKLRNPKLKPNEWIALNKYKAILQDERFGRDRVYIIPPPVDPDPEEFK